MKCLQCIKSIKCVKCIKRIKRIKCLKCIKMYKVYKVHEVLLPRTPPASYPTSVALIGNTFPFGGGPAFGTRMMCRCSRTGVVSRNW